MQRKVYLQSLELQLYKVISGMLRVFIIGTTGVGKTKLSVALATRLNGEIVSSDSKQLYKHASVMTAKVTPEEAQGVPHHMVDCLQLHQNEFNRNKFMSTAYGSLKQIEGRGKLPIIVGGTNYYTETLLFRQNQHENVSQIKEKDESNHEIEERVESMRHLSKEDKFAMLQKLDPPMAAKVHRNDEQKITLFLQRIIRSGQLVSSNYHKAELVPQTGQQVVFWVRNSNRDQLFGMVEKRIGDMLSKQGLVEIFSVYYYIEQWKRAKGEEIQVGDFETYSGAGSSIGLRQFKELYQQVKKQIEELFKKVQFEGQDGLPLYPLIYSHIYNHLNLVTFSPQTLSKCREQLLLDTKHYCKRQITWIKNRIFANPLHSNRFFVLELAQQQQGPELKLMERFEKQVLGKALTVLQAIGKDGFGSICQKEDEFTQSKVESLADWKKYYCEACQQQLNGAFSWTSHLESKRHQKQQRYIEKKDQRQDFIRKQREQARLRKEKKVRQQQEEAIGDQQSRQKGEAAM